MWPAAEGDVARTKRLRRPPGMSWRSKQRSALSCPRWRRRRGRRHTVSAIALSIEQPRLSANLISLMRRRRMAWRSFSSAPPSSPACLYAHYLAPLQPLPFLTALARLPLSTMPSCASLTCLHIYSPPCFPLSFSVRVEGREEGNQKRERRTGRTQWAWRDSCLM